MFLYGFVLGFIAWMILRVLYEARPSEWSNDKPWERMYND